MPFLGMSLVPILASLVLIPIVGHAPLPISMFAYDVMILMELISVTHAQLVMKAHYVLVANTICMIASNVLQDMVPQVVYVLLVQIKIAIIAQPVPRIVLSVKLVTGSTSEIA